MKDCMSLSGECKNRECPKGSRCCLNCCSCSLKREGMVCKGRKHKWEVPTKVEVTND